MDIQDTLQNRCEQERSNIRAAFDIFILELEQINSERGLLLQEATHAFEERAANKFRSNISKLLDND
jgi:hypothetical protein